MQVRTPNFWLGIFFRMEVNLSEVLLFYVAGSGCEHFIFSRVLFLPGIVQRVDESNFGILDFALYIIFL